MLENNLNEILTKRFNKSISEASNEEVYLALLELTKSNIKKKNYWSNCRIYCCFFFFWVSFWSKKYPL